MRFLFRKQKLKRTFQCCQQKKKATLVVDQHLHPQTRTKKKLCSIQKTKADTEAPKKLEKTHKICAFTIYCEDFFLELSCIQKTTWSLGQWSSWNFWEEKISLCLEKSALEISFDLATGSPSLIYFRRSHLFFWFQVLFLFHTRLSRAQTFFFLQDGYSKKFYLLNFPK